MNASRPFRAVLGLALGVLYASSAPAQELIQPKVKDRHFPVNCFCPLPFEATFVADGSMAIIRFSTNTVFYDDGGTPTWTQQYLDNVCVAPLDVYNANLGPGGSYSQNCYVLEPVANRFYFQNVSGLPLEETFDTDPIAHGWDLSNCYWDVTTTAPNNPGPGEPDIGDPAPPPFGALGLGQSTSAPGDSAVASITLTGLTPGGTYAVSGWWDVRRMDLEEVFLTLRVYGNSVAPVERRTWGALKRAYR